MSKNKNKQNEQSNEIKADASSVTIARTEVPNVQEVTQNETITTERTVILKDYTKKQIEESAAKNMLDDLISFGKDWAEQITSVHTELKDYTERELIVLALRRTYNIKNLNEDMLKRGWHTKENALNRINGFVKVRVKADKTQNLLTKNLIEAVEKLKQTENINRESAKERLLNCAYLKDNTNKEKITEEVLLSCFKITL